MNKLIVANWKMNPQSQKEAEIIFKGTVEITKKNKNVDVVVCVPFPFLNISKKVKIKNFSLGSQNVSSETSGPYTGEVSADMLKGFGVQYVIVGHSERRLLGDTNEIITRKILTTLKAKLLPILCIGEKSRDTDGSYLTFIKHQLHECLNSIPKPQMKNIVIAYEPLWAIGAQALREATPEEFTEIKIFIKKIISDMYGPTVAHSIKILYGGSVHPENAQEFLLKGNADGLLVGRDSLTPKKFGAIISATK